MVLSKIAFGFFMIMDIYSKSVLPELITKRSADTLRLISHDGKFTYYQTHAGVLLLGTNFKVAEILRGRVGTNYNLYSTPARKRILISQNEQYHTFLSPRTLKKIYAIGFGGSKKTLLGKGLAPRLHLGDSWASFYNPYTRKITLKNLDKPAVEQKIKLANTLNPYFIPQVVMPDSNTVIFSDINKKGYPGLIRYTRSTKKSSVIYKLPTRVKKIELCPKDGHVVVGEFGLDSLEPHSLIFTLPKNNPDITKRNIIYSSFDNDIGNIVCSIKGNHLYFVKNVSGLKNKEEFEAVRLDMKTKDIKVVSDVSYATGVVDMDSRLLLPYNGKHYVLLGENNIAHDDALKKK